jgi:transketolase
MPSEVIAMTSAPHTSSDPARVAHGIRRRVLEHTIANSGGYLSQACSAAEILAVLYTRVMNLGSSQAPAIPGPFVGVPGPANPVAVTGAAFNGPTAPDLDRFFLSAVHYALPLYATLIEVGRMHPNGLAQFNKDGSSVEMIGAEHSPGMEVTGGSLGQTLSQVGGIALARKLRGHTGRNWVLMSDGEFQSGQTWEALQALAFYQLDSVGVYVDVNRQQCDGRMDDVMRIEPLLARVQSFGARTSVTDGHDVQALVAAAQGARDGRPLVVLCYTDPARGMPLLEERKPRLHYVRFKDEAERQRYALCLEQMGT